MNYKIRENSWIAKVAAAKLTSQRMAIVIGNTIHLYKTGKQDFLNDKKWLKHELCHIKQFKQNGYVIFIVKYLWESFKHGYFNNKYEVEARNAETE